jgi:anti-sigma regulatory factor (Ser/Thr protein kinase)
MKDQAGQVFLKVRLNPDFLRLVTSFAEESAKAFGSSAPDALKLTLASEEIFAYLCRAGRTDETITIEAADGGYYVQVKFSFTTRDFNPRAFNLTSSIFLEDTESLEEMGLLIASRSVDRFYVAEDPQRGFGLVLVKEKSYPELGDIEVPQINPIKNFSLRTPHPDTLKLFVRLITAHYPSHLYPPAFLIPGKVVDMVASAEYGAKVAVDEKGQIGGGILWHRVGTKTVESFGPYLFQKPDGLGLSEALTDACLGEIAKTEAIGLISRYSTPELPKGYFESLGSIDLLQPDGSVMPWPLYFRQLHEDLGCQVWAHPVLEDFLRAEYKRLFFAREIRSTRYGGEQRPTYSVFAPQFDRTNRQITLRAMWDGKDALDNLSRHLKVLKAERLPNIFFEVDLGHAWQANLSQILVDSGFQPQLILPYGGEADVVVFQYRGGQ